jgi:hypothetical protein
MAAAKKTATIVNFFMGFSGNVAGHAMSDSRKQK